ncbi:hypothetical protein, partial [Pseudomonas viridiflava]|uniref:hypothetical protein n=1 Tax=Pseudomonas viridiflava TaxID=33069 RepID=UPI0013E046EE
NPKADHGLLCGEANRFDVSLIYLSGLSNSARFSCLLLLAGDFIKPGPLNRCGLTLLGCNSVLLGLQLLALFTFGGQLQLKSLILGCCIGISLLLFSVTLCLCSLFDEFL